MAAGDHPKPRLGVLVTYQFSVRYVLRTGMLRRLAEVVDPVVLLAWDDPGLAAEMEQCGAEVHRLPDAHFGERYLKHRRRVEIAYELELRSPTSRINRRKLWEANPLGRVARARRLARRWYDLGAVLRPGGRRAIAAQERVLLEADTSLAEADRVIDDLRLDALLSVTPYHKQDALILRAAERRGLPLVTSIISFDNVTSRNWIPVRFDRYLVWNEHNRRELLRSYPGLRDDQIAVTGAPQFDFYTDPARCWDDDVWRKALGLPAGRPVLLFGGGPEWIAPNELHVLAQLDDAVERGEIAGDPVILFRRHPMDPPERSASVISQLRHVVADAPWKVRDGQLGQSSASDRDIDRLVSTLAHAQVHVNTSSTMTVDGAFFDRPQAGPAYDDRPGHPAERAMQDLYRREHWLPINRSGGMVVARDRAELVRAVNDGFARPEARVAGRARLVREIATFTDGRSTERVVAEIAAALGCAARR